MASTVTKRTKILLLLGIIGTVFLILGCVSLIVFDDIIHSQVSKQIPLNKKGKTYQEWKSPKVPIYFQVWAFDIVNHLEILDGQKPAVLQRGPYTYREKRTKHGVKFFENGTVFYKERRSFVFDRSLSVGPENDTVTSVNLAMAAVMTVLRYEPSLLKTLVDGAFKFWGETLFVKMSVHDLLWGREDNILKAVTDLAKSYNVTLPINDTVGLLMGQNNSNTGDFIIHSGQRGLTDFASIVSWNGERELSVWTSDYANSINGSLGVFFPPFVRKDRNQDIFSTDLTRSLSLTFQKEVELHGIPLYKFYAPPITFANVSINPLNAGFCTPPGHCLPSGLLNMTNVYYGVPLVLSNPNFLFCDPDIVESVRGLRPDREAYENHLNIEPFTGITMDGAKRMQINLHLQRIDDFPETYKLRPVFMPILWLNESARIPKDQADDFKHQVLNMVFALTIVKYCLIGLGAFLLLIAASFPLVHRIVRNRSSDGDNGNIQRSRQSRGLNRTNRNNNSDDDPILDHTSGSDNGQDIY
ncbi:scavenger receptor class B member 1 [Elysia marginata]|uniref:Scavenger receptor class B member 1 n=1 Tax=Elysia marginata TaxID=1093978 RepID=A0AAV4J2G0_9GAST|nr:scavenger receptor class B member 1 [Elysia marginata]